MKRFLKAIATEYAAGRRPSVARAAVAAAAAAATAAGFTYKVLRH